MLPPPSLPSAAGAVGLVCGGLPRPSVDRRASPSTPTSNLPGPGRRGRQLAQNPKRQTRTEDSIRVSNDCFDASGEAPPSPPLVAAESSPPPPLLLRLRILLLLFLLLLLLRSLLPRLRLRLRFGLVKYLHSATCCAAYHASWMQPGGPLREAGSNGTHSGRRVPSRSRVVDIGRMLLLVNLQVALLLAGFGELAEFGIIGVCTRLSLSWQLVPDQMLRDFLHNTNQDVPFKPRLEPRIQPGRKYFPPTEV